MKTYDLLVNITSIPLVIGTFCNTNVFLNKDNQRCYYVIVGLSNTYAKYGASVTRFP